MATLTKYKVISDNSTVEFSSEEAAMTYADSVDGLPTIEMVVETLPNMTSQIVQDSISRAIVFGNALIVQFAAENVMLGITQAGKTNTVRKILAETISAMGTGSLYDAIYEIRQIPDEDKDSTFITDARLLSCINRIENYLGLPLSTEL